MEHATGYSLHGDRSASETWLVVRTACPLLLAIAGSALTPLPCAFSLVGIPTGTVTMLVIALANDYTTVVMVRAASAAQVSGYEEVLFSTGGYRARNAARVALVILLFGTLCGCLSAIQETASRAAAIALRGGAAGRGEEARRAVLELQVELLVDRRRLGRLVRLEARVREREGG